jgi:hypothetical protein
VGLSSTVVRQQSPSLKLYGLGFYFVFLFYFSGGHPMGCALHLGSSTRGGFVLVAMENSARRGRSRSRLPAHVHHQRVEEKKDPSSSS